METPCRGGKNRMVRGYSPYEKQHNIYYQTLQMVKKRNAWSTKVLSV
jgi:hypothetical protein